MKIYIVLGLALGLMGCQPPPAKNVSAIGRQARGSTSAVRGGASTSWGAITSTAGDQGFYTALYTLTAPQLSGVSSDQQLGYVASSAGQSTGVRFWGQAAMLPAAGGTGTLDSTSARLHLEIWDSNAVNSNGAVSPIVIHIGYDQTGYAGASGTVSGSNVNLTFTDGYGSVILQGTISGAQFSGQVYFANGATGGQAYPLGQFQVSACGFFTTCN